MADSMTKQDIFSDVVKTAPMTTQHDIVGVEEDPRGIRLEQDLLSLDTGLLTPLTPEVIARQATINVGMIGHVAHGKSTVVKALSGVLTARYKKEQERSITIKLGYANAKIYRRLDAAAGQANRFRAFGSASFLDERKRVMMPLNPKNPSGKAVVVAGPGAKDIKCNAGEWELVRHVSFVDCPGHDILMATMLNGAAVMDAAMLLVACNEACPQPQTAEHLAAIEIMKLENVLVLQNKVDLVKPAQAVEHFEAVKAFTKDTVAEHSPVIPISGALQYNFDVVAEHLAACIPVPRRDFTSAPRMMLIRSFDVNKPGQHVCALQGGVAGGSILRGVLRKGQAAEVRPGLVRKGLDGRVSCQPITTRVRSLFAEANELEYAVPGGLIGVGTTMDPTLTRGDQLVGQLLGAPGLLPPASIRLEVCFHLMRTLLGVRGDDGGGEDVAPLSKGEAVMVTVGATSAGATVKNVKADLAKLELTHPVCCDEGDKLVLSRRIRKAWRLVGWGQVKRGLACPRI